jgi:hypothetical protein
MANLWLVMAYTMSSTKRLKDSFSTNCLYTWVHGKSLTTHRVRVGVRPNLPSVAGTLLLEMREAFRTVTGARWTPAP